jgi:general secretion pathway protein J
MCRIIRKNKERQHPGFTLFEILLAVFILGIVASIIYKAYSGTFSIVDRTTKEAEIYAMARIALERIVEDLESMYIPYGESAEKEDGEDYYGFITREGQAGDKTFTNLIFTSKAHISFGEASKEDTIARGDMLEDEMPFTAPFSEVSREDTIAFSEASKLEYRWSEDTITRIGYYVKEGDNDETFVLCRSDQPNPDSNLESEIEFGPILCEGLSNVQFTCYDAQGNAYEGWDSRSDESGSKVPAMVTVRLSFLNASDPETPYIFTTGVAILAGLRR